MHEVIAELAEKVAAEWFETLQVVPDGVSDSGIGRIYEEFGGDEDDEQEMAIEILIRTAQLRLVTLICARQGDASEEQVYANF